jgi:hypothetical protein
MNKIIFDKNDQRLKIFLQLYLAAMLPLYNFVYKSNFVLWGCSIGLYLTFIALTFKSRLAMSMAFVGTFFSCSVWCVDLICQLFFDQMIFGVEVTNVFTSFLPFWVKLFSFYHVFTPVIWIYCLKKWGYEPKALYYFIFLYWFNLLAVYLFTTPSDNINWVFMPTVKMWQNISPLTWLILEMILLPIFIYYPMHLIAIRIFKK